MPDFPIHDVASAPEGSKDVLATIEKAYGMIPNVVGVIAESPTALRAYAGLQHALEHSELAPAEQHLVQLTVAVANRCEYCVAVHTAVAHRMAAPSDAIAAIREDRSTEDMRLEALRTFTRTVVQERGWVAPEAVAAFFAAGFERKHVLEILAHVTLKTLTNYVNHITQPELDAPFADHRWSSSPG
jgi:uncharacterized peroxidase-related enzyme